MFTVRQVAISVILTCNCDHRLILANRSDKPIKKGKKWVMTREGNGFLWNVFIFLDYVNKCKAHVGKPRLDHLKCRLRRAQAIHDYCLRRRIPLLYFKGMHH